MSRSQIKKGVAHRRSASGFRRTSRASIFVAGCLLAACLLIGCGSARRGAPFEAAFEPADTTLLAGRHVFMRYCNGCHPGGEGGLGPALNNKPLPGWMIRFQVRHGLGARSEEHTSELQSRENLVCRLL